MNLCPTRAGAFGLLGLFAAAVPAPALANDDGQIWTTASATVKLSDNWRLSEEVTFRFSDDRHGLYEIEINSLLGYRVGKGVTLWAGYTHNPQYSGGDFTVMERRAREQVTVDELARIGRGKLSGRLRLEQRWRDGIDGTGWRVRPYVKYTLPLPKSKVALAVTSEVFFNLNRTAFQGTRGLDRTRTFIGLSAPLSPKISAEAGYLNQHAFVRNAPDRDDHVASVTLGLSL